MLMPGPASNLHIHLRAWRHHRRLTLQVVADKIGSKINTISGWETGTRTVDLDDIAKLADAYGVHPAALLFAPDDQTQFETMRDVLNLVADMPPAVRETWLRLGQQLKAPA